MNLSDDRSSMNSFRFRRLVPLAERARAAQLKWNHQNRLSSSCHELAHLLNETSPPSATPRSLSLMIFLNSQFSGRHFGSRHSFESTPAHTGTY